MHSGQIRQPENSGKIREFAEPFPAAGIVPFLRIRAGLGTHAPALLGQWATQAPETPLGDRRPPKIRTGRGVFAACMPGRLW